MGEQRITVIMPSDAMADLEREAASRHMTLSEVARERLQRKDLSPIEAAALRALTAAVRDHVKREGDRPPEGVRT